MNNSALKLYELTDKEEGLNLKKFDDKQKNRLKDYMSRNYLCNEYIVA